MLLVGRYSYRFAHPPLLRHSHDGVIEICFLERGRQIYEFSASSLHCLRGGEVLVVQPGEVHGTGHLPEFPGRLFWVQIRLPRRGESFLGLGTDEAKALVDALLKLHRQFRVSANLRVRFAAAFEAEKLVDARFRAAAFKARILELLLACIESAERSNQSPLPQPIARALRSLEGASADRVGISELACRSGLSESYFKALFRQSMGMPPAEFLRVLRLEQAQLQLRTTTAPITDIALAAGFSSSQHFATAFRQQYGCTPSRFRTGHAGRPEADQPLHGAGVTFHPVESGDTGGSAAVAQIEISSDRPLR